MTNVVIILAGGRSERMGRPKALVTLAGMPLCLWTARAAEAMVPRPTILLVGAQEDFRAIKREIVAVQGLIALRDTVPHCGPAAALGAVVALMRAGRVAGPDPLTVERGVVVPTDHPLLQPRLLELLMASATVGGLAIPVIGGRPMHLLMGFCWTTLLQRQVTTIAPDSPMSALLRPGLDHLIAEEEVRAVDPELASAVQVSTPEDLRDAEATLARRGWKRPP